MNDATRRALRTLIWLSATAAGAIPALAAAFDLSAGVVTKIVAVFTFAGVMLTALVNALEDSGAIPALLKAPPSPGANPVPDDAG
jgi:hypothetical protein